MLLRICRRFVRTVSGLLKWKSNWKADLHHATIKFARFRAVGSVLLTFNELPDDLTERSLFVAFLPRDAMLAQYILSSWVCPSVCPSVHLSFTHRYCTKTTKRRIMQTTPHDRSGILVFLYQKTRQAFPNVIFRTTVQQLTRFKLT